MDIEKRFLMDDRFPAGMTFRSWVAFSLVTTPTSARIPLNRCCSSEMLKLRAGLRDGWIDFSQIFLAVRRFGHFWSVQNEKPRRLSKYFLVKATNLLWIIK
jgi:hypothetical protein